MSQANYISKQTGPFKHEPDNCWTKVFNEGKPWQRTFRIVLASAYNANGLIGSERNGIAVLDDDYENVVFSEHMGLHMGGVGHTPMQMEEIEKILQMDWDDFKQYCTGAKNYRILYGADIALPPSKVSDFEEWFEDLDEDRQEELMRERLVEVSPVAGYETMDYISLHSDFNAHYDLNCAMLYEKHSSQIEAHVNRDIFNGHEPDPSDPYGAPLRNRLDIVRSLTSHEMYSDGRYSSYQIAWSLDKFGADTSGKVNAEEYKPNEKYDERWQDYVDSDHRVEEWVFEDAVRTYTEAEYTTYPGDDQGQYRFAVGGDCGDKIALTKWFRYEGTEISWRDKDNYVTWLRELDNEDLRDFYRLVTHVDADVQKFKEDLAHQYSFRRMQTEELWDAGDLAPYESEPDDLEM